MDKTFDTMKMIDDYSRTLRMMFAWVQPAELRSILEKSLELQVETAKLVNKTVVDSVSQFSPSK